MHCMFVAPINPLVKPKGAVTCGPDRGIRDSTHDALRVSQRLRPTRHQIPTGENGQPTSSEGERIAGFAPAASSPMNLNAYCPSG